MENRGPDPSGNQDTLGRCGHRQLSRPTSHTETDQTVAREHEETLTLQMGGLQGSLCCALHSFRSFLAFALRFIMLFALCSTCQIPRIFYKLLPTFITFHFLQE